MIEVKNLTKKFGNFAALQDISFRIEKNSGVIGLLGPNGAGKTTTLRLLTGYLQATSGNLNIAGISPDSEESRVAIKSRIGYLAETTPLYPEMLVSEYLEFIGGARGLAAEQLEIAAREMIEKLELGSHLYTPIGILSKGFRQRVALAGALIHKPEIIILDEPTSGLDPNQISHIRELIKELGKTSTLIFSTHILQEVEELCERVIIINRGQVVADESAANLKNAQSCTLVARGENIPAGLCALDLVISCEAVSEKEDLPEGFIRYSIRLKEDKPEELFGRVAALSVESGWGIREFAPRSRSMQEVFHELTAQAAAEPASQT